MKVNKQSKPLRSKERGSPSGAAIREAAAAWIARRDAGLSDVALAELEVWLAADPRHRAAFSDYDSAWSVLDRPVRGSVADDVLEALQGLDRRRRRRRVTSGAAVMGLLLAGIALWTLPGQRPGGASHAVSATARVLLPERETLPDGTIVEFRQGAEIVTDFGRSTRRVALIRGDVHFQVAKDPARPFVVDADGVEVRAVGTAFSVQLGAEAVEVIVTAGRVAVEKLAAVAGEAASPGRSERDTKALLGAGEHATIELGSSDVEVRTIAPAELSERLAWRAPRLEFGGTPLSEVVTLLNQQAAARAGHRFSIEDPSIAHVRVSGLFRGDNTAGLLDLLDRGFDIVAERRGESEIVLRRAPPRE